MTDDIFEINSYEIEDIQNEINNLNKEVSNISDIANKELSSYKQSLVFGKATTKVIEQIEEISDSLMILSNTIQKGTDSMFEAEYKLLEEIKSLEIPKGFETIDTI